MGNFLFILTRGLEDPTRVTRALQLAKAAKETGHEVNIFLTDDAVFLAKDGMLDNVIAPTGDEAASHYHYLLEKKCPFISASPARKAARLAKKMLINPFSLPEHQKFLSWEMIRKY